MNHLAVFRHHKHLFLLALALAMGAVAAWLGHAAVREHMAELDDAARRGQEMVEVIVANRDLGKGETLSADALAVRPIPRQYAHAAALPPSSFAQIENARLQVPLRRGEALLQAHIEGLGQRVFSTIVAKGMRALTVEVDDISSNAGMLRPGDHVDLIYAARASSVASTPGGPGVADDQRVWPLLSNVHVMATGQSVTKQDAKGGERRYTNVTLELSPAEATRVLLAKARGVVTAVLRHPDDAVRNDAPPLGPEALLPGRAPRRPPPPAAGRPGRLATGIEYVVGGSASAGNGSGPLALARAAPPPAPVPRAALDPGGSFAEAATLPSTGEVR